MEKLEELKIKAPDTEVGILIARFQTDELTTGHKQLIDFVCKHHQKVIVYLGLSPLIGTHKYPLDYQARKQMIDSYVREKQSKDSTYADVLIHYIENMKENSDWSKKLDGLIATDARMQSVTLYGSRDSFINSYEGKYNTVELADTVNISATEIRRRIKASTRPNAEFRKGVIHSVYNRYPVVYGTVDAAILNEDVTEVMLAQKPNEKEWRFVGGYSDIMSNSDEEDVLKEIGEETHLEVSPPIYIGSTKIDDWRYRGEIDSIRTRFFKVTYLFGAPTPDDDIAKLKWFKIKDLRPAMIVYEHHVLVEMLLDNLKETDTLKKWKEALTGIIKL